VVLTWHPQGDYLAVQADKFTKTRKSTTTAFELFSLREKDTPIEMLELPSKGDKIVQLAWEPKVRAGASERSQMVARSMQACLAARDEPGSASGLAA
jgi:uncharacterized protein with WD repeat